MNFIDTNRQKQSALSGAIFLFILIIEIIIELYLPDHLMSNFVLFVFVEILPLIQLYLLVHFFIGFVKLGKVSSSKLMINSAYLLIGYQIIFFLLEFSRYLPKINLTSTVSYNISVIIFGLISLSFGVSILRLKMPYSTARSFAGFLTFSVGILYLTIEYAWIASFLIFLAYLAQIAFLYLTSKSKITN